MQNWKYYKDEHIEFYNSERAINSLVKALYEFENKWLDYLKSEYEDYQKERLN
jgi:cytochrome c peroxidase